MAGENIKKLRFFTTNQHELEPSVRTRTIKRFRTTGSLGLCGLWLILFIFLSCKTMPQSPDAYLNSGSLPLYSGASVYILADVHEARPMLSLIPIEELNNKQVKQMLDRSDYAMAAIFPAASGRRFHLAAWGNYPKSGAGMALSFDKSWEKKKSASKQNYWYSGSNKLSVAMTSRQIFAAGSLVNTPVDPYIGGANIPDDFAAFSRSAPLSCWIENPGPIIQRLLNNAGVPIRAPVNELFVNMYNPAPEKYEAVIRLQFENTSQARGVAAVLSLASRFSINDPDLALAMLFIRNPPVQNGRNLDIKTGVMSEAEVLQILGTLKF